MTISLPELLIAANNLCFYLAFKGFLHFMTSANSSPYIIDLITAYKKQNGELLHTDGRSTSSDYSSNLPIDSVDQILTITDKVIFK